MGYRGKGAPVSDARKFAAGLWKPLPYLACTRKYAFHAFVQAWYASRKVMIPRAGMPALGKHPLQPVRERAAPVRDGRTEHRV